MAVDQNSALGAIAGSVKIIGGHPPYIVSIADFPLNFSGFLDPVVTGSEDTFNFTLNAEGVAQLSNSSQLTGQITVVDAMRRSVTFEPFTFGLAPAAISPTTGSFFDTANEGTVVINLGAINATRPVVWSIVSGFDNGGANVLLDMQADGSMTLNADGVTYYGANPGDGTLTGFVTFVDADGRSPPAPVEITLTVVAGAQLETVASISMEHSVA